MTRPPLLSPVRLARAMLVGLVASGVLTSGLALAAGWTGPASPAPLNNTPELIWNAQESGFVPQDASFRITGSGVLGGQFAAGGYDLDASGIAVTAPTIWATDFGAGNATVYGDLVVDPGTGAITLGGVRLTEWPAVSDADITGIVAGPNLTGGGDTGEVTLDLSATPTVDTLIANSGVIAPAVAFSVPDNARIYWNTNFGFNRIEFSSRPHFFQGLTTQANSVSTFSGPVDVTGGNGLLTAQAGVRTPNVCTLGGFACNSAPATGADRITTSNLCIGADCRSSWPAGGGGGGSVTSISSGTGITATPNPIIGAGTIALDTAYTDGRYINTAGNELKTGTLRIEDTVGTPLLTVTNSGAGSAIIATGSDNAIYAQGTIAGSFNNNTGVNTHAGLGSTTAGGEFNYNGTNRANISSSLFAGDFTGNVRVTGNLNVTGDESPGRLCLSGVCNASWPAGGAGTYVRIIGDTMTGPLIINSQLTVNSSGIGPAGNFTTSGERGVVAASTAAGAGASGSTAGLYGSGNGGQGVYAVSNTGNGLEARTTSGASAGTFVRGGTTVSLATATDGVNSSARVVAPTYCIGASCISAWPSVSITAGSGITVAPSPLTGAGTISLDTTFGDSRYVNNIGPDQVIGEFAVNSTSGFQSLDVNNTGGGRAIDAQSSSNTTIVANNTSAGGVAGYFHNGSFVDTYLAWGGTYGVYTTGQLYTTGNVRGASVTIGAVTKSAWPTITQVTRTNIAITAGWNAAPTACPAGSVVSGISCFTWDVATFYPGCTSRAAAATNNLELYGQGKNVSYTLFCLQ